jgi:hypothetical protein
MNASDRFMRFAVECDAMAEFSPSSENETVWRQLAERWRKFPSKAAYLTCRNSNSTHQNIALTDQKQAAYASVKAADLRAQLFPAAPPLLPATY